MSLFVIVHHSYERNSEYIRLCDAIACMRASTSLFCSLFTHKACVMCKCNVSMQGAQVDGSMAERSFSLSLDPFAYCMEICADLVFECRLQSTDAGPFSDCAHIAYFLLPPTCSRHLFLLAFLFVPFGSLARCSIGNGMTDAQFHRYSKVITYFICLSIGEFHVDHLAIYRLDST